MKNQLPRLPGSALKVSDGWSGAGSNHLYPTHVEVELGYDNLNYALF
jgi:hypothetical protein